MAKQCNVCTEEVPENKQYLKKAGICRRCYDLRNKYGLTDAQILEHITHPDYRRGRGGHRMRTVLAQARKVETPGEVQTFFPRKHIVTVWECSDGREFGTELEAMRHEMDHLRDRLKKLQKEK